MRLKWLVVLPIILVIPAAAFAQKIPHIMPVPYNLDRYWEDVQGELPKPVALFLREFAGKGMPCRARGWARTPLDGGPQYDIRTVKVMQEFKDWEELDKFLAIHIFRVVFRWLVFQGDVVVRVALADIRVKVTWSGDSVWLEEPLAGTITENAVVTDLTACCPVHE